MVFGLDYLVFAIGLVGLGLALVAVSVGRSHPRFNAAPSTGVEFTLDRGEIAQMSPAALTILEKMQIPVSTAGALAILSARFADVKTLDIGNIGQPVSLNATWAADRGVLHITPIGDGRTKLTILENTAADRLFIQSRSHHLLQKVEDVVEITGFPVWQADSHDQVIITNQAFRNLPENINMALHQAAAQLDTPGERIRVESERGLPFWFDVNYHAIENRKIYYAIDVTAVVKAEQAQRNFVQTLTKTFATLSIGLAIFDKNRQLVLFNPALVDLTTLPAEFLSARPNLLSVFDRLRDKHIMPEPKNYASWREKLALVVAAAAEGTFSEVWNLPTGQTYRISGRPHPDGALAFLFEDITAEVAATLKYRSELEFYHSTLDQIDTAVAIFSMSGNLIMANQAHDDLWEIAPDTGLIDVTIDQIQSEWQTKSRPAPFWGDLRDFLQQTKNRTSWQDQVMLTNGILVDCAVLPLPNQHTAVTFRLREIGDINATKERSIPA